MNAHAWAGSAYSTPSAPIRTLRGTEYELFVRVTRQLKAAQAGSGAAGFPAIVQALHENGSLWTTLAADVADPDNGLPAALRAQIYYLAEFTRVHSRRVLAGKASLDALIDVNAAIMRGLRGEEGAA